MAPVTADRLHKQSDRPRPSLQLAAARPAIDADRHEAYMPAPVP
ncbi:MAG: hypothetical protein QOK28_3332, partial [Actinomycetota bacterium]